MYGLIFLDTSDFGFYRGNGETTGRQVYTGFKPLRIDKNVSNGSTHWSIWDEAPLRMTIINLKEQCLESY